MREALISVIVAVYNIKEYLPRCVDSVLGQTYKNLEIILVDDGSSDGSGQICDAYADRDGRVRREIISALWMGTTGSSRICTAPCMRPVRGKGQKWQPADINRLQRQPLLTLPQVIVYHYQRGRHWKYMSAAMKGI